MKDHIFIEIHRADGAEIPGTQDEAGWYPPDQAIKLLEQVLDTLRKERPYDPGRDGFAALKPCP